ncbi:uncharacterized protein NECHADRAFT_84330 [Fusarium vanettenii 77-13-4]|uniref:Protein kinase domain-containing protein n=1 Tax=Fusarium vanettenii (strain ATCC MYA-4622 / CBS 123669 / FGSC 9596 / NRRL 45880 / 77-13-4) TaxID=660122 RepID=C7ZCT2_FUSV7|nr:uncharacterized protein NECHADRAFT_84330 [Fusarium vanettenii 77-13-4]EEU37975.1 predicted protein [Fusarium vanettenii 77-13-4]
MAEEYDEGNWRQISVKFRFHGNTVLAAGDWSDREHPNVLRLTIIRSSFDQAIISILLALPYTFQNFARALFPGYFLPSRIVLKKMKPEWDEEFDNEVRMYDRLRSVQGHLIPICYGLAWCDGKRALLLSEVNGVLPFEQPLDSPLDADEFCRRLRAAYGELGSFGLMYGDPKLDNYLLVDDRIVIVDLESAEEAEEEGAIERVVESNVEFARDRYRSYLKNRYELM